MAGQKQSRGVCLFCEKETTKGAMTRHLLSCPRRLEASERAQNGLGDEETLLYLRVQDAYAKEFWLDLEMKGAAPLKKLDEYLREIWLECCGHMSEFSRGGWGSSKIGMSQTAVKAFLASPQLTHIYDFGTSSETLVTVVAVREGKALSKNPIALMARNLMPEVTCQNCEAISTHLCMECQHEDQKPGFLCAEHVKKHPHKNYGKPLKLVNSPRLGMCGYDGPAKPPY